MATRPCGSLTSSSRPEVRRRHVASPQVFCRITRTTRPTTWPLTEEEVGPSHSMGCMDIATMLREWRRVGWPDRGRRGNWSATVPR